MLPPGFGGREKTVRRLDPLKMPNVIHDLGQLARDLGSQVAKWVPNWDWIPRPLCNDVRYALILFSGRRRFADIANWISWESNVVPISIDTAVDPHHGNLNNIDVWVQLVRARKILGCHAAPPCETWSLARWLRDGDHPGPRPLRNKVHPWCIPEPSLREVKQAVCGSVLMCRALYLVALVYLHGGCFTVEHPRGVAEDCDGPQWCIWNAGITHLIRLAPGVQLTQFLQGPLGRDFAKPTCILQGRLPFLASMIYANYASGWSATSTLGGKDSQGRWKTMEAKEYPPLLSRIIAAQFKWFDEQSSFSGSEDDPEGLSAAIEKLSKVWDPYASSTNDGVMLHDYQPGLDG